MVRAFFFFFYPIPQQEYGAFFQVRVEVKTDDEEDDDDGSG